MKKPFGVLNITKKKYVEFFEFPEQSKKFIEKRLDNSIYEVQKWINSIDVVSGYNNQAYRFTGNIYADSGVKNIYW